MSAAEKLRALDAVWKTEGTEEAWQVYKTLMPALPQIVAVLEAVEKALDQDHGDGIPTMAIGAALSALDEELGDVT